MSRILMATVPLSGHVNPGLPIAKRLVERGHEVVWYCGNHFREKIISTGARFESFRTATDFHDQTISKLHGPIPTTSLLAQGKFYIRYVFYGSMPAYYSDLKEILTHFDADVIITDEWFTGGMPFGEKGEKPLIMYGNSPLIIVSDDAPAPGTGLQPRNNAYGRNRDRTTNFVLNLVLRGLVREINIIRAKAGLPAMTHFFAEQCIRHTAITLKFITPIFEFPRKYIPEQIRFVGPILPEVDTDIKLSWLDKLNKDKPVIFITQGSVDFNNTKKLIIPALKALLNEDMTIIVSTGGKPIEEIANHFSSNNIIVEAFIPYKVIMPYVDLMITNGGYGGVSTALSFGVPLIVAGNSEDKPDVASRVVYCGAGIDLKTGTPRPKKIRKAVYRILNDHRYRQNAEKVRDDFNSHDAVTESVFLIEEFLNKKT